MRAFLIALLLCLPLQAIAGTIPPLAVITEGELTSTILTDTLGSRTTTTELPSSSAVHWGPRFPVYDYDSVNTTLGMGWMSASAGRYALNVSAGGRAESDRFADGYSVSTTGIEQSGWFEFDVPVTRQTIYTIAMDTPLSVWLDGSLLDPKPVPWTHYFRKVVKLTEGRHRIDFTNNQFSDDSDTYGKWYAGFSFVPEPPAWTLAVGLVLCGLVWFRNR